MRNSYLGILEYKAIYTRKSNNVCGYDDDHNLIVTEKIFEALEKFYYSNSKIQSYFAPTKKNSFKALQAQNYVGVIQLKDGATIEILPKIANVSDNEKGLEDTRKIVIKMLCTLKNSPFKYFDHANLRSAKMPLLEIFISMFLSELARLVQRGIKSDYVNREENLAFLKGKLKFCEHLKQNLVHKERFFVAYQEYQADRIENRLIKTTLEFLYKKSKSSANQQRIREFMFVFDEISVSSDPKNDFDKVKTNRQMKDYEQALMWCKLFLLGNSFSPYKGDDVAFALLYDMNLLFENFVADWLKKRARRLEIKTQDRAYHLVQTHGSDKKFQLKPDIVARKGKDVVFIADTKWKVINSKLSRENYKISQADMYQLYAYGKKYDGGKKLYLVYPKNENFIHHMHIKAFEYEDGLVLKAIPFDLAGACKIGAR